MNAAVHDQLSIHPTAIAAEARLLVDRVKDLRAQLHRMPRNELRSMLGRQLSKAQLSLELAVIAGTECDERGDWK